MKHMCTRKQASKKLRIFPHVSTVLNILPLFLKCVFRRSTRNMDREHESDKNCVFGLEHETWNMNHETRTSKKNAAHIFKKLDGYKQKKFKEKNMISPTEMFPKPSK